MTPLESENIFLKARIADVENRLHRLQRPVSADERDQFEATKVRADAVAAMFGDSVPDPALGEGLLTYRKRILRPFLQHSPQFKEARLDSMDGPTLGLVEHEVYPAAIAASKARADAQSGHLVAHVERDVAGRQITKFDGDMMAWLSPFVADGARCRIQRGES